MNTINLKQIEVWFVAGSQPLYGPETLKQVATNAQQIGQALDRASSIPVQVLVKPRVCPDRLLVAGGVARSVRVREHFRAFAERQGMTFVDLPNDDGLYLDALGCAVAASEHGFRRPA